MKAWIPDNKLLDVTHKILTYLYEREIKGKKPLDTKEGILWWLIRQTIFDEEPMIDEALCELVNRHYLKSYTPKHECNKRISEIGQNENKERRIYYSLNKESMANIIHTIKAIEKYKEAMEKDISEFNKKRRIEWENKSIFH